MKKSMKLKLCCPRCGGNEFKLKKLPLIDINNINNISYLLNDEKIQVTCKNCGLEDYVLNLVPSVIVVSKID